MNKNSEEQPLVISNVPIDSEENLENRLHGPSIMSRNEATNSTIAVLIFGVGIIFMSAWVVINPGEIGIVTTLGRIRSIDQGLHHLTPFVSNVEKMSTKVQLLQERNTIPTREGLSVSLDTAVLYRLDPNMAENIYKTVGPYYRDVLIIPEAASAVRGHTSASDAKALYTSGREAIQESIKNDLKTVLSPRGIIIEAVLLKDVKLPEELSKSIEAKAKAEQDAAQMQFVLEKEKQEAERKAIEAQGIADFQRIVSEGISPELLQWKGVEATERLAESTNSKIVLIGNSGSDLPVMLSAAD